MATPLDSIIQEQLLDLRRKLEEATKAYRDEKHYLQLIQEVDAALNRLDTGTYGLCEACKETIEIELLTSNPLVRYCIEHMTPSQKNALEEDLQLAIQIQKALLPPRGLSFSGWEVSYLYEGASPMSGDYCDMIETEDETLYFIIGDVKGKGVAASMLMAHLHATFRALLSLNLPIDQLMGRASRAFCESSLPAYFATLVCGKATSTGEVEISNAGHPPPLLFSSGEIKQIKASGLPLGMFCDTKFAAETIQMHPGDVILLYTDGLIESTNASGIEYGLDRLSGFLRGHHQLSPESLISACADDVKEHMSGTRKTDDLTIMVIRNSRT